MKFSSHDRDNDLWSSGSCARGDGGWWYNSCSQIELNDKINMVISACMLIMRTFIQHM